MANNVILRAEFTLNNTSQTDKEKLPHSDLTKGVDISGLTTDKAATTSGDKALEMVSDKLLGSLAPAAIAGTVIQAAKFTVNYGMSSAVSAASFQGDPIKARILSNKQAVTNEIMNVGSSIAMGAVAGSIFGPLGAAVGAGLAAVAVGLQYIPRAINHAKDVSDYNRGKQAEEFILAGERDRIQENVRQFR